MAHDVRFRHVLPRKSVRLNRFFRVERGVLAPTRGERNARGSRNRGSRSRALPGAGDARGTNRVQVGERAGSVAGEASQRGARVRRVARVALGVRLRERLAAFRARTVARRSRVGRPERSPKPSRAPPRRARGTGGARGGGCARDGATARRERDATGFLLERVLVRFAFYRRLLVGFVDLLIRVHVEALQTPHRVALGDGVELGVDELASRHGRADGLVVIVRGV